MQPASKVVHADLAQFGWKMKGTTNCISMPRHPGHVFSMMPIERLHLAANQSRSEDAMPCHATHRMHAIRSIERKDKKNKNGLKPALQNNACYVDTESVDLGLCSRQYRAMII